jgi:hypothetical protein
LHKKEELEAISEKEDEGNDNELQDYSVNMDNNPKDNGNKLLQKPADPQEQDDGFDWSSLPDKNYTW